MIDIIALILIVAAIWPQLVGRWIAVVERSYLKSAEKGRSSFVTRHLASVVRTKSK